MLSSSFTGCTYHVGSSTSCAFLVVQHNIFIACPKWRSLTSGRGEGGDRDSHVDAHVHPEDDVEADEHKGHKPGKYAIPPFDVRPALHDTHSENNHPRANLGKKHLLRRIRGQDTWQLAFHEHCRWQSEVAAAQIMGAHIHYCRQISGFSLFVTGVGRTHVAIKIGCT
jgi:hypothetical protein